MRKEKDFIGSVEINNSSLFGIHSARAQENFPTTKPIHIEWYKSIGLVKWACYKTYQNFVTKISQKVESKALNFPKIEDHKIKALIEAAMEVSGGEHFEHFIVPALSGGAGTSFNLNINEIIANVALNKLGFSSGNYHEIDPIEMANVFQSTNDVIPTALKIAAMKLLEKLEVVLNDLREQVEKHEKSSRDVLRLSYTQYQEAVPSSFGKLFSSYSDALSRDWWRISKCFERIKVVNLGGGAVGTGISIPRYFIFEVVDKLRDISKLPLGRSENLVDTTCNLDSFVEVHAILKSHAVNLEKMVSDLRLLSSDLVGRKLIEIPSKQVGSSIMPGKVNPVIIEFVISCCHQIYANDLIITSLSAQGSLDLNPYLPLIGQSLLESLDLLIAAGKTLNKKLLAELKINKEQSVTNVYYSPSITTGLIPIIGYHKAGELAREMKKEKKSILEVNEKLNVIDQKKLENFLKPQNLLKLGYSVSDILEM